jgi:hypothetical protein
MRLDENAIYRTRGGKKVGLVVLRLITGNSRFNILVEYQPANGMQQYAETQFELVDWRGYVFGASEHHPRDLIQFIEYNEETYFQ